MKTILAIVMTFALLTSGAVLADDGNQGTGNRTNDCTNPNNCPPEVCTQGCPAGNPIVDPTLMTDQNVMDEVGELIIDAARDTFQLMIY